jgi:putative N6-adenine-specific DNA methylase
MPAWTAIAPPGLEPVVARELTELGWTVEIEPGAVTFEAPLLEGAPLAGRLRSPSRLLLQVGKGAVRSLEEAAVLVRKIDWSPYLHPRAEVIVGVSSKGSRIHRDDTLKKKVENALKDALRPLLGRSSTQRFRPKVSQRIQMRVVEDRAWVSIDAGGDDLLHRRGWREATGKAPLRENLAAAMLLAAGWTGDEPLVDPFCGGGTLPIEAALLAAGRPPGVGRSYAFEEWPVLLGTRWRGEGAKGGGRRGEAPIIIGADHDAEAIQAAMANAQRAGVSVQWFHQDVRELEAPAPFGLVVANPPYGLRLGQNVGGMYTTFGNTLRDRFSGWRALFLTSDPAMARRVSPRVERLTHFSNGGIPVGLYAVEL